MSAPTSTDPDRDALLAAYRLDAWPTVMTPEKAACLRHPTHVNVEGTYLWGHFEEANFEGLQLDLDQSDPFLQDGVRYRIEGLLLPGLEPGQLCAGFGGATLRPFVIEAISQGSPMQIPGLRVRAYRSPGVVEGDATPRVSHFDVFTGHKNGVAYVAVVRALGRSGNFPYVHSRCRRAWLDLFSEDAFSVFFSGPVGSGQEPLPPVDLPGDPAEGILAVRDRLIQRIQQPPSGVPADGVIMAFAEGAVFCLRLGDHRVLRRTSAAIDTILWEHTFLRYPPEGWPRSALPDYSSNIIASMLSPGPGKVPVHSASTGVGDRWLILSGHLHGNVIGHVSDEEFAAGLRGESPAAIVAWIEALAARIPKKNNPDEPVDWALVVMDVVPSAPEPSRSPNDPAANTLDPEALLAQLHELEKNRT